MGEAVGYLQASIRALVNERRELQLRLSNSKRWSAKAFTVEKKRDRPVDSTGIAPILGSAETVEPPAYPVEKRPKVELDDSTIKRSKNIFGSLLGHLQKAKTRLDDEQFKKPAELQRAVSAQVSQKLELEKKNLAELRRRDIHERHQKDVARMKELQKELQSKEADLLRLNLQKHYSHMKNFIRTDSTPTIFWSPAKHNDASRKLQDATRSEIQAKIESLASKFTVIVEEQWKVVTERHAPCTDDLKEEEPQMHPDLINDDSDEDDRDEVMTENISKDESKTSGIASIEVNKS